MLCALLRITGAVHAVTVTGTIKFLPDQIVKIASATTFILSLTAAFLHAQAVPGLLSYQGKVFDSSGVGLGTGTPVNRKMIFRLFDASTGGTRLWSEQQTVPLSNGEFSVILGQGVEAPYNDSPESTRPSLLTVFGGSNRYLEIVVDNGDGTFNTADTPITPRQRFISTPFVFRASLADGVADGNDFNLRDPNHGLGWYGTDRLFNGININGPVLYGYNGGGLGAVNGTAQNLALRWTNNGNVGIGTATPSEKLDVLGNGKLSGDLIVGGSATFVGGNMVAPPAKNNGGAGMRLTLYPGSTTTAPYGMGIDGYTLYSVVPNIASHKWYGGTTPQMSLNGSNGNLDITGSVTAASVATTGSVSAASVTATGNVRAGSLRSTGGLSFGGYGANPTEGGSSGNFIAFTSPGYSEDFIGYSHNTFYMKDSPGGGDNIQPDLVIGGSLRSNKISANGKLLAVGDEDLRVIRGIVKGEPNYVTKVQGSGFTTRKALNPNQTINNAVYEVIFSTPFSGVPSVTAEWNRFNAGWNEDRLFVTIYDPSPSGFKFVVLADGGNYFLYETVSFIAAGPR